MIHTENLFQSFLVLVLLVLTAIWLRRRSTILRQEEGVFGRLVTDFAVPAVIFASLSRDRVSGQDLLLALLLFGTIAVVMLIAWLIGRRMGLAKPVLGSVILVAGVGSASTLGYSLVHHAFGGDRSVMNEVVVMSEFGVVLPLFVFGVAVAMYFGEGRGGKAGLWAATRNFLHSPIFIALVLGLAASFIGIPQNNWVVRLLNAFLDVASESLALLVAFTVGLMLRPIAYRKIAKLVALVAVLKLAVEPLIAGTAALALGLPEFERELLVLEAALPSGALAAVLAARYGCDGAVASALLIATYLLALLTMPLIFWIAF